MADSGHSRAEVPRCGGGSLEEAIVAGMRQWGMAGCVPVAWQVWMAHALH